MGSDITKTNQANIVTKGAKFQYIRSNVLMAKTEVLVARGPLLGPIVVMASSNELGLEYKASIRFTVSKAHDPMSSMSQNEWVIKGWSRCSKECGGGKQHLIVRYFSEIIISDTIIFPYLYSLEKKDLKKCLILVCFCP